MKLGQSSHCLDNGPESITGVVMMKTGLRLQLPPEHLGLRLDDRQFRDHVMLPSFVLVRIRRLEG
jgi:hypothetical protein